MPHALCPLPLPPTLPPTLFPPAILPPPYPECDTSMLLTKGVVTHAAD